MVQGMGQGNVLVWGLGLLFVGFFAWISNHSSTFVEKMSPGMVL